MQRISRVMNVIQGDRFQDCPQVGDTSSGLSLKFLLAVDDQDKKMRLPFRSYSQNFGEVVKRFIINSQLPQPVNSQFGVEYIRNGEMVGSSMRLELYKEEIEDSDYVYFRVYALTNHLAQQKLKELGKEVSQKAIPEDKSGIENNIKLLIRKPNNQYIELIVNRFSYMKQLKYELCKSQNLDFQEFSLVFIGKKMTEDWKTLDQYGLEDESVVLLALKVNMGCFSPESQILTGEGSKKARELVKGQRVMSFNAEKKLMELDTIVSVHRTMLSQYLQVHLQNGTVLLCTANHTFLTSEGTWLSFLYQQGKNRLSAGQSILNFVLQPVKITQIKHTSLLHPQQFLHICTQTNHSFLLNGFISHNMQIKVVNTQDGSQFTLNIVETDTIQLLKLKIQQKLKINKYQILLVLNKRELKDNESIADYLQDIKNCHHLEMIVHEEHTLVVNRVKTKKEYRFKLDKNRDIRDLKKEIGQMLEIDRDFLILIVNNVEMLNPQKIGEFELHKNFNRINLIQIQEEQITASKVRFEQSKILNVRTTENEYLRLNYYSLREMRVEHFILSFIPNSKKCYSLLFGELTLQPCDLLKEIQNYPIFNNQTINCYVIRLYDKISFFGNLRPTGRYQDKDLAILPTQAAAFEKSLVQIKKIMQKVDYVYDVKAKFNEKLEDFIKPIQHYTNIKSYHILRTFLTKFMLADRKLVHQLQGYEFCCALMRSLQAVPAYVGETHRLLKDTRFRDIYKKRAETLYFQNLLSTHANPASINRANRKNYTILHMQSLTGRQIGLFSDTKDEIVFLPFTYFFINKIKHEQDYDEAWLIEMPTPLSFQKDIFMWVDDQPNSQENKGISNLIDFSRYELVQLVSTELAQAWMREFGWILKWSNKAIKVMSDMNRLQGQNKVMQKEAGLNLIESLHNNFGYTIPIFIYCKNVIAARKALKAREVNAARVQKITSNEFQLIDYLSSP